jgi:Mg-chelatase subunit ChlD
MKQNVKVAYTPELVESLKDGQVFVFGSNLIGYHSGGASLVAMQRFGAVWGQAEGPQGQCYAIPVDIRGEAVENVSAYMKRHIDKFLAYAKAHPELFFLVIRVGCGNAGFDEEFVAPFFKEAMKMDNVSLPKSFVEILKRSETGKKDNTKQRVFNLIILDESGSMATIAKQAVSGLNETFQTIRNAQKEHQEQQHFISFVTFNSARIKSVMNRQKVESDKKLKWTDYNPDDCTPLFDAMGRSLNELKSHVSDEDVVLVTIITDGYENASREYSGHDIKTLVAELKAKGWVFAYIGTNQDVDAVADDMGIRSRMCYDYSPSGADCMFELERSSKREFFARLHREGRNFMKEESYDYFESNDQDDEEPEKEPDVTWDVNDDSSSSQTVDNSDDDKQDEEEDTLLQEDTQSVKSSEEPEEPKGFWEKVKNILKG